MGNVYLILQIDSKGQETHKFGITKNDPELRVRQLSTGNPNQIRLLDYYSSENYKKIENVLHKKFKAYQTESQNEWLKLPHEIISSFKEECKKVDELITFMKANNPFYK